MRAEWEVICMAGYSRMMAASAVAAVVMFAVQGPAAAEALKLVERATTDAVTDTGQEGDTVGDLLTFANAVFDESNTTEVGSNNGWCIRTAVGKAWECFWTLTLSDGQITVQGPFLDAGDSVLAVTGGTGAYAGVRGDMTLHSRNAEGSEYGFGYNLIR